MTNPEPSEGVRHISDDARELIDRMLRSRTVRGSNMGNPSADGVVDAMLALHEYIAELESRCEKLERELAKNPLAATLRPQSEQKAKGYRTAPENGRTPPCTAYNSDPEVDT